MLALTASDLKNVAKGKGPFRKCSCPFAVVQLHPPDGGNADVLGKTEVVQDSLDPQWHTQFVIDFDPKFQRYINVYIFDKSTLDPKRNYITVTQTEGYKIMDCVEVVSVNDIIKACETGRPFSETMAINKGILKIFAEVQNHNDDKVLSGQMYLHIRGVRLKNIESAGLLKGLIDPYFEIWKSLGKTSRDMCLIYRSEIIMDHVNPLWDACRMDIKALCGGYKDRRLEIRVYDWEKYRKDRLIGKVETTVKKLMNLSLRTKGNGDLENSLQLKDPANPTMSTGTIVVLEAQIDEDYS